MILNVHPNLLETLRLIWMRGFVMRFRDRLRCQSFPQISVFDLKYILRESVEDIIGNDYPRFRRLTTVSRVIEVVTRFQKIQRRSLSNVIFRKIQNLQVK